MNLWSEMVNLHVPITDVSDLSTILKVCFSVAWLLGVVCVLHLTYKFIRNYTLVTVNCWFCNQDSRVPFKQKKEWICCRCEQFNGFTNKGDYSRSIPEQHHERLNSRKLGIIAPTTNNLSQSNGLCRTCNANQELKIRQIASYVPLREADYDQEIELFKEKLERSYKLCPICVRTVQSTLKLKSRLYCSQNIPEIENHSAKISLTKKDHSKKWKHLTSFLFTTVTLMGLSLWHYFKLSEFNIESGTFIKWPAIFVLPTVSGDDYNLFLNFMVPLSAALFTKNCLGKITVLRSILIGFLSFLTHDHVFSTLKIAFVILAIIYVVLKRTKKRRFSVNSYEKLSKEHHKLDFEDQDHANVQENSQKRDTPLCGEFSDLSLGGAQSVSSSSKVSYLFRSNKLLVQPAKLILDDMDDSADTIKSFQTASSGYDSSVTTFLRRSPDGISEFDSVSQVGYKRFSSSSRGSPNALVSFNSLGTVCTPSYERFYGVSPQLKPDQQASVLETSKVQVNAFFSVLQIFLCSLAFFILGFSFQLLLSTLKF